MKSLLLAVDFSESTDRTVETAAKLCDGTSTKIWLVHVGSPQSDAFGVQLVRKVVEGDAPPELRDSQERLEGLAKSLRARGLEVEVRLVRGEPVAAIVTEARHLGVDLIVVGARGHSSLLRALMGSVSEGILRRSSVPILIVPDRGED